MRPSDTNTPTGAAPLAVVMISLNEAHNMAAVLHDLKDFAQEVFLVDSYSADDTVGIALAHGVYVVQRRFRGFGDQWNFALEHLPITAPWTMKLDPDERLTDALKASIRKHLARSSAEGLIVHRRLWFMGRPVQVRQDILRLWRTGKCQFSAVLVNEHPIVDGPLERLDGDLEHHDSPNLHHWFEKQNNYTTVEALAAWRGDQLSSRPRLFGNTLERRMWLKSAGHKLPFLPILVFLNSLVAQGAWRAGRTGWTWALLRGDVHRMILYKRREMNRLGRFYAPPRPPIGAPDPRVLHYD